MKDQGGCQEEASASSNSNSSSSSSSSTVFVVPSCVQQLQKDARYQKGKALMKDKKYEESVSVFGNLLEAMSSSSSSATDSMMALELAPVYHEYGHGLLVLSETSADVFGEKMQDSKAAVVEELSKALGASSAEEREEEKTDLELAWEMLEVARLIYMQHVAQGGQWVQKELSHVYLRLGDLGMESGNFIQARQDYQSSLDLTIGYSKNPMTENAIADLHCCMAMACVYQHANPEKEAKENLADEETSEVENLLELGRNHYIQAGRVMASMLYQKAQELNSEQLPKALEFFLPRPTAKNGKGKTVTSALLLNGEEADVKAAILKVLVDPSIAEPLLEYVELYVELKEKAEGVSRMEQDEKEPKAEPPMTQIGFSDNTNTVSSENIEHKPTTNLVPVRKKRKTTKTTESDNSAIMMSDALQQEKNK